jgi:RNA polymerase sigma-70 factor (ECF subfamily)
MRSENKLLNQNIQDTDPALAESGMDKDLSPTTADATADMEQVYARYIGPIYRFLYNKVGNREDAEDLASETFLKASHRLDTCRSEPSIARWLFTVAGTVLADHWRRYYRYGALLPFDEFHGEPAIETETPGAQRSQTERRVAATLEALPQRHRRVLELRFLRGFSVLETAQELGVTPGNAKVLQYRALARAVQLDSGPPPSSPVSCAPGRSGDPGYPDPAA